MCQTHRPVYSIEQDIHGNEEQKHALVNLPSSRINVNVLHPAFFILVHSDQGQLEHVDNNCSEDEKEVNQNPEGQGCYAFSNLIENCPAMIAENLTVPQGRKLWLRLKELSKKGTMSPEVPFVQEQPEDKRKKFDDMIIKRRKKLGLYYEDKG